MPKNNVNERINTNQNTGTKNFDFSKTYAISLGGGGLKGAYQGGALKALRELGIKANAYAGTSIGALNAAMACLGKFDKLEDMWKNFKLSDMMVIDDKVGEYLTTMQFNKLSLSEIADVFKNSVLQGGFDVTPLVNLIDENIDEEQLRNSPIDFGLITLSVSDKKGLELMKSEIPQGKLKDLLLASCYLPVFKREKLHNKEYLDGGFFNVIPNTLLTSKGYTDIIEIDLISLGRYVKPQVDANIITIRPSSDLGHPLEYDRELILKNFEMGYLDTYKVICGYLGNHYYIKDNREKPQESDDFHYLQELLKLPESLIKKFDPKIDRPYHRFLIEKVLPNIAKKLDLPSEFTYESLYFEILERFAKMLELEHLKVYDYNEFIDLINLSQITTRFKKIQNQNFVDEIKNFVANMKSELLKSDNDDVAQKDKDSLNTKELNEFEMLIAKAAIVLIN